MLEILPVVGIGDVRPGADLAELIADAAPWLADGDVLVVTSKIVSKAEGRLVPVPTGGPEREAARDEVLTAETARTVARRGHTRIVQTHHGFVMASAGIDSSNVDRQHLVLLPKDPDASARSLRGALRERLGIDVAVVVSDTMGRPWRVGLTDIALGAAGIDALRDYRGEFDAYGNEMHITQMAVIDELSSAAELVKGKSDLVPVAVVRGFGSRPGAPDGPGAAVLIRDPDQDLFSLGTAEARSQALRTAATLTSRVAVLAGAGLNDVEVAAALGRALALVRPVATPGTVFTVDGGSVRATGTDPIALGMDLHRLRIALFAEGLAATVRPLPDGAGADVLVGPAEPPAGRR